MKTTANSKQTKKAGASGNKPSDKSSVRIGVSAEIGTDLATARTLTRPEIGAAAIMEKWSPDTYDINVLADELTAQVRAVNEGDMRRTEGFLLSQAQALDAIFVNLMRRSMTQTTLMHWEAYMRMGMKAQSQCRATLQVLADLKNPRPLAFVRQANIAHGPQQVNNGPTAGDSPTNTRRRARARNTGSEKNKLLEVEHGQPGGRMDTRAAQEAERSHQAVETVEAVHRAKKP